jgi:DNA-binding NtrC family response regulator
MPSRICIVSPDSAFAESIGGRLEGWGLSVVLESDLGRVTPSLVDAEGVDVVLLAVRRHEEGPLRWLSSMKRAIPALEVILLNLAGEIRVSIEGMRAGASHELSAPFDLEALRRALSAALRRRKKRMGKARPSLSERFERAMAAATFAEAGEAETAREILEEDGAPPARRPPGKTGRRREGT